MIIDSHTHAWAPREEYPWVSDCTPSGFERLVYTSENLRTHMAELDIDRAVLVATPIHGRGSPYLMDCLEDHPDQFMGIGVLDYFADDIDVQLERAFSHDGFLGVRFGATHEYDSLWERRNDTVDWITSSGLEPFWDALRSYNSPQVHLRIAPRQLDQAAQLANSHPHVTFVLDHMAGPTPSEHDLDSSPYDQMCELAEYSNVYVKVSHTPSEKRYPFTDLHRLIRELTSCFGTERMVWGTDYAYAAVRRLPWQTSEWLDEVDTLSDSDRSRLLGRTFQSLIP
jgi:predicted TIM-barrel fold metal-dependent hydrolase